MWPFPFGKKKIPPMPPIPPPIPPHQSDIEALMKIFPGLDPEIANIYLETNGRNLQKASEQILAAQQEQEEYKQPSSSRDQPSSSRGQPSSSRGQPSSSRGQPSSSRGPLNLGDYMGDEIDFNHPMFKEKVEKEVKFYEFDKWLDDNFSEDATTEAIEIRRKLANLFGKKKWSVTDPRGDGFCGLYAATIDYNSDGSKLISRDDIISYIVEGIKAYYEARELHIKNEIPLPNELTNPTYYLTFTPQGINPTTGEKIEEDSLYITEESVKDDESRAALEERLQILKTLSNLPGEVFMFLAYAYKRNFLVLYYAKGSTKPAFYVWTPCYADVYRIDDDGPITYPYEGATSIMFNNQHYFLFHNPNIERKQEAITRILNGEWDGTTQARGLRKSRKARKARKAIFTTKMKKQKYSIKKMRHPKKRTKKY